MSNLITRGVRTHGGRRSKRFQDVRTRVAFQLIVPRAAHEVVVARSPDQLVAVAVARERVIER